MTTVKNYISELDVEMAKTEKLITRCERALEFKKQDGDVDNLKSINDNLNMR